MTELGDRETDVTGIVKAWIPRGEARPRLDAEGRIVKIDHGGYGFIQCDDGKPDCFVHDSALRLDEHGRPRVDLPVGGHVRFMRVQSDRGLRAESVELVEDVPPAETEAPSSRISA